VEHSGIRAPLSEPLIETRAICKSYRSLLAVASVDFDLTAGEVHGLVGANGAGKSTFTKILTGAIRPDSGTIHLGGKEITLGSPRDGLALGIAGIHQELATVPKMSVLSNVFLGNPISKGLFLDRTAMAKRFQEISDTFDLRMPASTPAGKLSVAGRQKVEILKAIQAGRKILIMDEPTAALDPLDRQALYNLIRQLAAAGSSIIFISHDLNEVLTVCGRVSVMRDGALIDTRPVSRWTTDTLVAAMLGDTPQIKLAAREHSCASETVFRACNISVEGRVSDVSFDVRRGEILGVAGLVGSGRSELLRAIFGAERSATGQIELKGRMRGLPRSVREALALGIIMVPEDRKLQGLVLSRDGYFNIALSNLSRFSRAGILRRSRMRCRFEGIARDVKLAERRLHSQTGRLSGGNQQKVLLARWMVREPQLLLLDEPSRGVDVAARAEIYSTIAKLASRGVGIVLVSSDMDEVIQNSDRIIVLQGGSCVGVLSRGEADLESVLKLKFSVARGLA
jgi:ABC-type sugar transport system ATPase subunit